MRRLTTIAMGLALLVFAAPAAADELSLSASSIFPGETISYTVKVEEHPVIRMGIIARVRLTNDPACLLEESTTQHVLSSAGYFKPTTETHLLSGLYEALGTYQVCEYYLKEEGEQNAKPQIIKAFEVVAHTCTEKSEVGTFPNCSTRTCQELGNCPPAPVAPAPPAVAPVVPVPPVVTPVVKPLSKLAKALKQCKKQYKHNKKKLAKCEKQAQKKYGPKPKRRR
jgi:hypothetical protein